MVLSLLCNHWQFLLGFSAMAKQNQNPKKQKNKKPKKKMTRPNSLPLLPLLGCAILFFCVVFLFFFLVYWFFGFLFSGSLLVFLQWLNKTKIKKTRNKKKTKRNDKTQLSAITPPWGVQSCFFCFVLFFLFVFLVSWSSAMAKQNQNQKKTRNQNRKKNDKT